MWAKQRYKRWDIMKNYEEDVKRLLKDDTLVHLVSGLASETGEVCGVFQKSAYKQQPVDTVNLKEELGDVLFYVTALAGKYGYVLTDLMDSNIKKLDKRHKV